MGLYVETCWKLRSPCHKPRFNGIDIRASVPEVEAFMLNIVTNAMSPDDMALFIARHAYDLDGATTASTLSEEPRSEA